MMRQQLDATQRALGDRHPHTLVSLSNLASFLEGMGRHAESEPLLREEVILHPSISHP